MDAFITEKEYKLECAKKKKCKGKRLKKDQTWSFWSSSSMESWTALLRLDILWDYIHRLLPTMAVHPVFEVLSFYRIFCTKPWLIGSFAMWLNSISPTIETIINNWRIYLELPPVTIRYDPKMRETHISGDTLKV